MAVLQKMRGWGIVLSILVALPLLLFIIDPSQIAQALQSISSKYDVGVINGKSISYTEFQNTVEKYNTINEIMTGSSATSEQQQSQLRDAAWEELVYSNLFVPKCNEAGLYVDVDEIVDLTSGDAISPIIMSNPIFVDESGVFSKTQLNLFLDQVEEDETGRVKLYWDFLKSNVVNGQYFQKYYNLFSSASVKNSLEIAEEIAGNNVTSDIEYVMVPFGFAKDSTITVSNSEIKNYYNSHKDFFRQKANCEIEYVVYEVVPSADDIAAANEEYVEKYEEFATTDNVKNFLSRNNSDVQYSDYFVTGDDLASVAGTEVKNFVNENTTGVSPIYSSNNAFTSVRILASAMVPEQVYVRHILLQGENVAKADSLVNVLNRGGSFSELVANYSADQGTSYNDTLGDLGWMSNTRMIPGFEPCLTAAVGKPFVVNTVYGTHIVEVTEASEPKLQKKVAVFKKTVVPSQTTHNSYFNLANRLSTLAGGNIKNYDAAVDSVSRIEGAIAGTYSHSLTITEATRNFGAIQNAKEVTRWVFDNKPGKVSSVIDVDRKYYFVVAVKEASKEGYADLKKVAPSIENRLYSEKLAAKKTAEVAEKIQGLTDLNEIAELLGGTVSTKTGIAFSSTGARELEPALVGAVSVAQEGEIAAPVAGSFATYVFKVVARNNGTFYTEDDAKTSSSELLNNLGRILVPVMSQDVDVKDNRERFY